MNFGQLKIFLLFGISVVFLVTTIGCQKNPAIGKVTGTVTLDGKPLPNASVTFHPDNSNTIPSLGGTDPNGKYELFYTDGKTGAIPGQYTVTISTGQAWNNIPETVPSQYLDKTTSELQFVVKPGNQTINIELKSK
jgi:hypothetical protein